MFGGNGVLFVLDRRNQNDPPRHQNPIQEDHHEQS
jgi:hypothetical protein